MKPIELLQAELEKIKNKKTFEQGTAKMKFEQDLKKSLESIENRYSEQITEYETWIEMDPGITKNHFETGKLKIWNNPGDTTFKAKHNRNKTLELSFDSIHKALNMPVDEQTKHIKDTYSLNDRVTVRQVLCNFANIEKWDPDFELRLLRIKKEEIKDTGEIQAGSAY